MSVLFYNVEILWLVVLILYYECFVDLMVSVEKCLVICGSWVIVDIVVGDDGWVCVVGLLVWVCVLG